MPRIAIIGYCQTVALLNAVGSWRQSLGRELTAEDGEIQTAINPHNDSTKAGLLDIIAVDEFSEFNDAKFCLLNSGSHPAARFMQRQKGDDLHIWHADAFKRFLDRAAGFDVIVSLLNGSELGTACRMDAPDFDFFPYDDDDADRPPIDSLYIGQRTAQNVSWIQASLTLMRHLLPSKKIIHVAPPPPLLAGAPEERQRPAVRLKIHYENIRRLRQVTSGLNIQFLEERPEAVSVDGFLKPEFDDGHARGNSEFGRLTARAILKLM